MSNRYNSIQQKPADPAALQRLTLREKEVVGYLAEGCSNKYIAAELGVSQRTIEAHRARIFVKFGVRNAVQLTQRWISLQHKTEPVYLPARQLDPDQPVGSNAMLIAASARSGARSARHWPS